MPCGRKKKHGSGSQLDDELRRDPDWIVDVEVMHIVRLPSVGFAWTTMSE
jgi:hypothetical protein